MLAGDCVLRRRRAFDEFRGGKSLEEWVLTRKGGLK
jgi:hypothetical protein